MRRGVHLSRRFTALLALAFAMVLAGLFFRSPGLAAMGATVGAVVFIGASVPTRLRLSVDHDVGGGEPPEHEAIPMHVGGENRGRSVLLEWRLRLPPRSRVVDGSDCGFFFLKRGARFREGLEAEFLLFGRHTVGPVSVRVVDPFGFASLEAGFGSPVDLRVRPAALELPKTILRAKQQRTLMGMFEVAQPGHGMEFFGLRDYVVGDRPRDVNWKASARAGKFVVNQHQRENDAEIVVFVDHRATSAVGRPSTSPFAQASRTALAVALAHLRARDAVRWITYGPPRRRAEPEATRDAQSIIRELVDAEPAGEATLADTLAAVLPVLRPGSPVLIASGLVGDPSVPEAVTRLIAMEFKVTIVAEAPDWGDAASAATRHWDQEREAMIARLRAMGATVVARLPGQLLEASIEQAEVLA